MNDSTADATADVSAGAPNGRDAVDHHPVLRAIMFGAGCALIAVGFLLGFVPFLPGFPLGILGIGLLAASSARVRRLLRRATHRLPARWRRRLRFHLKKRT